MIYLLFLLLTVIVGSVILASLSNGGQATDEEVKKDVTPATPSPKDDGTETNIKTMKTYRVAETADGITNKNTGDLAGDNSYISGEFCARHKDDNGDDTCGSSKITEYTVSYPADYKFGQYALCNPGGAVGGTGDYKCGKCDEQCTKSKCEFQKNACNSKDDCNKDVTRCTPNPGRQRNRFAKGYWYSWPEATQCKTLSDLKEGKCKWYVDERTKSIDTGDLQGMGYKMMTNDEMEKNCDGKTTCTEAEIKKFVQTYETDNLKVLNKWSNGQKIAALSSSSSRFRAPCDYDAPISGGGGGEGEGCGQNEKCRITDPTAQLRGQYSGVCVPTKSCRMTADCGPSERCAVFIKDRTAAPGKSNIYKKCVDEKM